MNIEINDEIKKQFGDFPEVVHFDENIYDLDLSVIHSSWASFE